VLSTTSTGALNAILEGMAVDPAGNRYLAIFLQNAAPPPGPPVLPGLPPNRGTEVQKVGLDGTVLYTAWLRGAGDPSRAVMAVNTAGEVLLAGATASPNYIQPSPGALAQSPAGTYVLKLSAAGDSVPIAAVLNLPFASVVSLALDGESNVYLGVRGPLLRV